MLSRAPGPIPSRLGRWIPSTRCPASQPYAACCTLGFRAALTRDLRVCLFAPSAVSVVLCPVVVLPFVSLRLSSVSSVLRDCQTMVLCQACGLSWNRARPWRRTPALCQQMACYHDTASASRGLCRRCMVAAGICTASGTGGNSLSAAPPSCCPGTASLAGAALLSHCFTALARRCAFSGPGPAACTTAALTPPLCYFNLSL